MTVHNYTLFKLLVKFGATEEQAEEASTIDTSNLATKADIATLELKIEQMQSAIIKWNIAAMGVLVTIFTAIMMLLRVTT